MSSTSLVFEALLLGSKKGVAMLLQERGVQVVLAEDDEALAECFRLRHGAYCKDHPYEPENEDEAEEDDWDKLKLSVSALVLVDKKPYATMRYVKPNLSQEFRLPVHEAVAKAESSIKELEPGQNPVEFSRFASPREVQKSVKVDILMQHCVRAALLRTLVEHAADQGFNYGIFLVERKLVVTLESKMKLKVNHLGEKIPYKGWRFPCGISLEEFQRSWDAPTADIL